MKPLLALLLLTTAAGAETLPGFDHLTVYAPPPPPAGSRHLVSPGDRNLHRPTGGQSRLCRNHGAGRPRHRGGRASAGCHFPRLGRQHRKPRLAGRGACRPRRHRGGRQPSGRHLGRQFSAPTAHGHRPHPRSCRPRGGGQGRPGLRPRHRRRECHRTRLFAGRGNRAGRRRRLVRRRRLCRLLRPLRRRRPRLPLHGQGRRGPPRPSPPNGRPT